MLVDGPDELMEAFTYPFALWRIYLHPGQERVAHGSFSGPVRVTGGPGTGKTVAVLHRAKHLPERVTKDRSVLVTTFTKTLTGLLEDSLRLLIEDEDVLRRIDVRHVDQFANQVVAAEHGKIRILPAEDEKARWRNLAAESSLPVTDAFLAQEWREVILAQEITSLDAYLTASRSGRGKPLGSHMRTQLWKAFSAFTEQLTKQRQWTYETVCVEAAALLASRDVKPYKHILIDEAQDLVPWQWRVLRAAVSRTPDDLFIAGDTHQRIYGHRVSLKQVGINVVGRAERLKLNYRTTAEILGWSMGVLHGQQIDDMNGDLETLAGCRSDVHGQRPVLTGSPTKQAEFDDLVSAVRRWLADGVQPEQIGIAARSGALVDLVVNKLVAAGLPAVSLAKRPAQGGEISAATMHRMKGLEFRCVAIIGAADHQLPSPAAVTPIEEDRVGHELDVQRERCLVFVACTRAGKAQGVMARHGKPASPTLDLL